MRGVVPRIAIYWIRPKEFKPTYLILTRVAILRDARQSALLQDEVD